MQGEYYRDPYGWSFETFRNPRLWTRASTRHPHGSLQAAGLTITVLAVLGWLLAQLIW